MGGDNIVTYEALSAMFTLGMLIVAGISFCDKKGK